jgi:hypothetical protein
MLKLLLNEGPACQFFNQFVNGTDGALVLAVRYKYAKPGEKYSNAHLKTVYFSGETTCDEFIRLIKQFETQVGTLVDSKTGFVFTEKQLVVYCTTNGRDMEQINRETVAKLSHAMLMRENVGKQCVQKTFDSLFLTTPCKGFTNHTIDCDDKLETMQSIAKSVFIDSNSARELLKELGLEYTEIETKSGCHLIVRGTEFNKQTIGAVYKKYSHTGEIGDMMCAVPGTSQGGFEVRFV